MKELQIVDKTYYYTLVAIIFALVLFNCYFLVNSEPAPKSLIGAIPIFIQGALLYLLYTKNIWSQKAIRIWIIVVFFGVQVIKIISAFLLDWVNDMRDDKYSEVLISSDKIIYAIALILVGVILWILNSGFGEIKEIENQNSE